MENINKFDYQNDWSSWIGKEIMKWSKKPFKSGKVIGIPESMDINPRSGKIAFKMKDDQTLVDCYQCALKEIIEKITYRYYNTPHGITGIPLNVIKHQDGEYTFLSGRTPDYSWIRTRDLYYTEDEARNAPVAQFAR